MSERIAVLGAGPMGLSVAYQLAKDGYKPVVFEASDRVGGMAATFDFSGTEVERYYHFHCTSDYAFLRILDELDLAEDMRWKETRMAYWYKDRLQPWGNPIALLKFRGLSLVAKIRYGLHAFLSTKRNDWRKLDEERATHWIKRWVGSEAYEILWRNLFDLKFYHFSNDISAAWIWSRVRRLGRSRYNLLREKLGYLEGGSGRLLRALKAEIENRGGAIRLSSPVRKVVIENDQVKGVEFGSGEYEEFEKVISTVPLPYVPRILADLPKELTDGYRRVKNIGVVCVIAKLTRRLSENFWVNINDPEMDVPGLVEYTNLRPLNADEHIVYVPFYMPTDIPKYSDHDQVFLEKVIRYLQRINPNISAADVKDIRLHRYEYAQPIGEPGFLDLLPPIDVPVTGLWVADTSYYYPEDRGFSESIEFGRMLADMAAK